MPERFLGNRVGGVDYKIGSQSYKTIATEQEFEATLGQDDVTTFNDEPDTAWEEGQSIQRFRMAARLKDGSLASKPVLPTQAQGITFTQLFSASNTLSGVANFSRLLIRRTVAQTGVLAMEGIYVGPTVLVWTTS